MSAPGAFARKEVREITRTSRIVVLPAIVLFFALTSPLLAKFTPVLLQAVAGDQLGGLTLPEPTVNDAYGQWVKNLSQIGIFAIIISYGGIISGERRRGTAVLVLTKPLSRAAFVTTKVWVHVTFLLLVTTVGTLATWGMSALVFGSAPPGPLFGASALWLGSAVVYLALVTLLSTWLRSSAGAAGFGIAAYALLSIGAIWQPLADFTPAGLPGAAATLAGGATLTTVAPMLAVSLGVVAAAVAVSVWVFEHQEL